MGKKYAIANIYSYDQYERCLKSGEIDAVYIALPNHMHREYAVRAAQAGIHVLCEKPMAVTEEECRDMMEAARAANVKLMIAYRLHFEEANLESVRIGQSGDVGELRYITGAFSQQIAKREDIRVKFSTSQGGGPVYDMGIYCINATRYLFQDDPTEVSAFAASRQDPLYEKVDEMVSVTMRFPENRLATFTCSFGAADYGTFTLVGTKGTVTLDPAYTYNGEIKQTVTLGKTKAEQSFAERDQFAAELLYFSNCILNDRQPEPSAEEGLADVQIILAIHESVRSGSPQKLAIAPPPQRPRRDMSIHLPPSKRPKLVDAFLPAK